MGTRKIIATNTVVTLLVEERDTKNQGLAKETLPGKRKMGELKKFYKECNDNGNIIKTPIAIEYEKVKFTVDDIELSMWCTTNNLNEDKNNY